MPQYGIIMLSDKAWARLKDGWVAGTESEVDEEETARDGEVLTDDETL